MVAAANKVQHHEPAAANVAAARIDYSLRISGGDCGIDCIATRAKHLSAGFGGQALRCYHHAVRGLHGNGRGGVRSSDPGNHKGCRPDRRPQKIPEGDTHGEGLPQRLARRFSRM